jgi:hypothetical protein
VRVDRLALREAREDFLAIVAADEPIRAGGHAEALGWVLADLHAHRPLALLQEHVALTAVITRAPELATSLVAIAGFQPARIEYEPSSRYVSWRHRWTGTAVQLWDAALPLLDWADSRPT